MIGLLITEIYWSRYIIKVTIKPCIGCSELGAGEMSSVPIY